MDELWRDVPGYEGLYQISIDTKEGRCRRIHKRGTYRELCNIPGRIIWNLSKDGKELPWQAARWIALTYPELIENEWFEGAEIDHINTDPMDNRPCNLRWTDRTGQMNNSLTKQHRSQALTNHPNLSKPVCQYNRQGDLLAVYPSTREAGRVTGISSGNIRNCCNGYKYKTAGGYVWKYGA